VTFEDPGYVKAAEMLQDLVKKGYFPEGVNALDEDLSEASSLLYNKKAGMYLMGTWFLSVAKQQFPDMLDQLDFFPFPAVEDGKGDPSNLVGSPGQDYMSVTTTSENMEVAYDYFTSQVMSDEWISSMIENGYIPPVKGASDMLTDPMLKKSAGYFEAAKRVQVYYDQFLPPAMGQKHLDLVQALFGLAMTPEEVAKGHEAAILEELNK
jgi:raffinose/stachyose/melibiose transport system substrate-binding protein